MNKKIFIVLNSAWNLWNFRAGLIRALVNAGYEVVAVAPPDEYVDRLSAFGCRYVALPMDNQGKNPVWDLALLLRFFRLLRNERPGVCLLYTVKPNVYGSLAAHALGIPVINNIAGLGAAFMKGGWLTQLVKGLYMIALYRSRKVFFQNDDDRHLFITGHLVRADMTDLLPGSGIDLSKYLPSPLPGNSTVKFILIARMLWDKGVGEFVYAARILKQKGVDADFGLLGFLEVQNPAAISRQQINDWVAEGTVRYLGVSDNVCVEIEQADCVVLPSYREGTPRALLEAAAMSRPIVTSDAVGCRQVVDDGINGFLCKPKDAFDLAVKLERIVSMSPAERVEMGSRGRVKIEREFDEQIVIAKYLSAIQKALI